LETFEESTVLEVPGDFIDRLHQVEATQVDVEIVVLNGDEVSLVFEQSITDMDRRVNDLRQLVDVLNDLGHHRLLHHANVVLELGERLLDDIKRKLELAT
jgi:hypothetical protein